MNCELVNIRDAENGWLTHRCERCGRDVKSHSLASRTTRKCTVLGLGDYIATGFAALGITKERVFRIIGTDCKCEQKQEALNEAGKKLGF